MKSISHLKLEVHLDILVKPRTEEQIAKVIKLLKEEEVPYLVIGNGSNLLIKDGGIRGVVIEISKQLQ